MCRTSGHPSGSPVDRVDPLQALIRADWPTCCSWSIAAETGAAELVARRNGCQAESAGGLLPICCGCKKIRDDEGYWSALELFIDRHSEAQFSHGICPDCVERYPSPK